LPPNAAFFEGVSCPSLALCVAVDSIGNVVTSTDPTGGTGAWAKAAIDSNHLLNAVFCSSLPQCFVTDRDGTAFTSTDPTGGPGAWKVSSGTPRVSSGTCPTTTLCVAVDGQHVFTTTDPTAGSWTQTSIPGMYGVACPTASLCLAVGTAGTLATSTDPASGGWTSTSIDHGRQLSSISCPSVSLCVAVDATGHVVSSTDPTGGPLTWAPALVDGDPCADVTPCTLENIQTSDATGLHTVDTSELAGSRQSLTGLMLTGDVLTWSHGGSPRTVTLKRSGSTRR
jgi:hypothetical protein